MIEAAVTFLVALVCIALLFVLFDIFTDGT